MRTRILVTLTAITIICIMTLFGESYAGVSDAGVLFLRIAPGARAAGMGEAFVAVADDATATHWNPAGLGKYPLTSQFHEFSMRHDEKVRTKAIDILLGRVPDDYSESIGEFKLNADGITRVTDSSEEHYIEYDVDPNMPIVQYIASNARMDDRELLKVSVRAIARENTGVSYDQIEAQRQRLLGYLNDSQESEVNALFERILIDWHNLKIVPESITFLEERLNFDLQDESLTSEEYSDILETLGSATRQGRPRLLKIPYVVLVAIWKDYSLPWETRIEDIALLRNDIPQENYTKYDIWAMTTTGLAKWNSETELWESNMRLSPRKGELVDDLVSSFAAVSDEERLKSLRQRVLFVNYGVTEKDINSIIANIRASYGDGQEPSAMFDLDLKNLPDWYNGMTLSPEKFSVFMSAYKTANADNNLTSEELAQLEFSVHVLNAGRLPGSLEIPYSLPFQSDPTCIAATDKLLWVGTENGLFVFNGRAWRKYTVEDGLPSNKINDLSVYDGNRLWVATGRGVAHYYKGKWSFYASETGLVDDAFTTVYGFSRDKAWAAADNKLWFFNGNRWRSDYRYTAVVNDTLSRIVRRFSGVVDENYIKDVAEQLKTKNNLQTDYPEPGTEIMIPFSIAFRHPITAMVYNSPDNKLWVGTTHGLKIFSNGEFRVFGWQPYTAPRDMTLTEAALDHDPDSSPANAQRMAHLIKSYNYIQGDNIRKGQTVHVYSNHLGSHIYTLSAADGRVFVGTVFGTIAYDGERFSSYFRNNLQTERTVRIIDRDGERWFATPRKVVVYAHARSEISLMHAQYAPELASDLYFENISYARNLGDDWGTIGINATFMSYGSIPRTLEGSSAVVDTFHAFDGALSLTYGTRVSPGLSFGLTSRIIYSRLSPQGSGAEIGSGTATAFAVDAGILYNTPIDRLTFGAALTNLGPNIAYIDAAQSDPLPRNLAFGLAYDLIRNPYNKFTIVGEINKRITNLSGSLSEEIKEAIQNVGFEYWYGSFIALRAGYKNDDAGAINYFTVGAGLQYNRIRFDFAYIPTSKNVALANTLRISLTGRL